MTASPNRMFRSNHFKLGTFSTNCSGGMTVTKIPERWDATWDSNLATISSIATWCWAQ